MRFATLGLVALGLAACIDAQLVPCGDNVCPGAKICNAGACVYPDQLTACGDVADSTPCTFTGTTEAVCVGGICEPLGCGNRVVTPDEVCDDGNNVNGDGCSADCKSTETCGNGIADFATGEQCDDGNQIDDDGCRNNCTLPRCGDGQVDKFEQCDPNSTIPLTTTCTDLNFDLGVLTCSPTCILDVVDSCERYGWKLVHDLPYGSSVSGDQGTVVVVNSSTRVLEIGDATGWTTHGANYVDVDMIGDTIGVATGTTVEMRIAGVWSTLPDPPIPANTQIAQIVLAADATPVVLAKGSGGCEVEIYDGAWSAVPEPATCIGLFVDTKTDFVVATSDPAIQWNIAGQTINRATTERPIDVGFHGSIEIVESSNANVMAEQLGVAGPGPNISYLTGGFNVVISEQRVLETGGLVYAMSTNEFDNKAHRASGFRVEDFASPQVLNGAPRTFYKTHDSHLYAYGNERLWQLGKLARTLRTSPSDMGVLPQLRYGIAPDGVFVVCGNMLWESSTNGWAQVSASASISCDAMWVGSETAIYAARRPGNVQGVYFWNGSTWTEQKIFGSTPMIALSLSGSGTTGYAALTDGSTARGQGGSWTPLDALSAGCTAGSIAVSGAIVIAAGQCNGASTIWQLSGTTWIELHHETTGGLVTQLYVAPDGTIFATTSTATIVGSGTTWQRYTNIGGQVGGTSATDVFAIETGGGHNGWHWDGTVWSQLQLDPTLSFNALVVSPTDVVFLGAPFPAPTPISWIGFLRGP